MKIEEFIGEIETIIEVDPGTITKDDVLASFVGWDSMAVISFIAMADSKIGVAVDANLLVSCKTVGDLAGLFKGVVE
jgi:acyl carrier protein